MFSVNLMGIDFGSVLLNVLAIIGIIIAGGFVVFFLGDLLISIYDPHNSALKIKKKDDKVQQIQQPEKPQELTYEQGMKYDSVDYNKAMEEENMLKSQSSQPIFYSEPAKIEPVQEEIDETKIMPEKHEDFSQEDIFAQLRAEEEQFKQDKLKAATEHKNVFAEVQAKKNKEEDEDTDEFNFDDIFFSEDDLNETNDEQEAKDNEQIEQQIEEHSNEVNNEEINKDNEAEQEVLAEDEPLISKEDAEELAKNDAYLAELKIQNENLKKQVEELKREKIQFVNTQEEPLVVEKLEERLTELNERLKFNEKELRAIKKEYIPLNRVRKTLESDKKKLRRKEALVARQKVMLYGVNNITDIDPEKAKKLQEDLDLLDGLRLSVQHCEEVINNSEERYPILETSYKVLTRTVNNIKKDIEETKVLMEKAKK